MSSPNRLLIAAVLVAVSAPAAMADPLVYDPYRPGYHPGHPGWYMRYDRIPDWFERRDTVTLQVGDAVAANQAMQMRDPWPPYVANRHIQFNGVVMDRAIDQYKAGTVPEPVVITASD